MAKTNWILSPKSHTQQRPSPRYLYLVLAPNWMTVKCRYEHGKFFPIGGRPEWMGVYFYYNNSKNIIGYRSLGEFK